MFGQNTDVNKDLFAVETSKITSGQKGQRIHPH